MQSKPVKVFLSVLLALSLGACGGNDDPVVEAVSDAGSDIELDYLYLNRSEVYPGDSVRVEWRASDSLIFDVRVYLSKDRGISDNDEIIVQEECGIEANDHCSNNDEVEFVCRYRSDNSFDCREDGDLLQRNDLTEFFDELPQAAYLIVEVCSDGECDWREREITFY